MIGKLLVLGQNDLFLVWFSIRGLKSVFFPIYRSFYKARNGMLSAAFRGVEVIFFTAHRAPGKQVSVSCTASLILKSHLSSTFKVYALAGELNLDIYLVSLSKKGLDDSTLNELITKIPSRSLVLMEDIDAAFFRGINREGSASVGDAGPESENPGQDIQPVAAVTLSGLLGAIDGVAAQEGRILFATTNKYTALDPALVRAGRLDVHVCFENAGKWQAEELFRCFFPANAEKFRGAISKANGKKELKSHTGSYSITQEELDVLAKQFAECIPEREFSMAAIQGLLMQYKTRPRSAVEEVNIWVESERKKRGDVGREPTRPNLNEEAESEKESDSSLSNNGAEICPDQREKAIQTDSSEDAQSFEGSTAPD